MPISIDQCCVTLHLFQGKVYAVISNSKTSCYCHIKFFTILLFFCSTCVILYLPMYGDIESNPGPKTKSKKSKLFLAAPLECQ